MYDVLFLLCSFASDEKTQVKQQNQLQEELKMLTERQRRK